MLCDDILKIIIVLLDDDSCVMLARTCHHLHNLVHNIRKVVTITDNVFEAVRCGSLLSIKRANASTFDLCAAALMHGVTIDILKHIHSETNDDEAAYKLCKRGTLVSVQHMLRVATLVSYAVKHSKQELLEHMKIVAGDAYVDHIIHQGDDSKLTGGSISEWIDMKYAIKADDVVAFSHINAKLSNHHPSTFMQFVIKYDAINIVREHMIDLNEVSDITWFEHTHDMTLRMAVLLLELYNNHERLVWGIINACNYRLTEMLRERGLYNKKLTMRSHRVEFV